VYAVAILPNDGCENLAAIVVSSLPRHRFLPYTAGGKAIMKFQQILSIVLCLTCVTMSEHVFSQWTVDVEGNYIMSIPYNDVRIPSQGGTRIDIANDLHTETTFTYRGRISYTINNRHIISALAAPLTIKSSGRLSRDVTYSGEVFEANTNIDATYKFNSFRLTYRYMFVYRDNLKIGAGITGKIRDANITLQGEDAHADFPDLGFVPLVNFYLHWLPTERLGVLFEGDALGTTKGRAEDIFAGITLQASPTIRLKGGYRILEGGADVSDNYNFTFVNYAALGAMILF